MIGQKKDHSDRAKNGSTYASHELDGGKIQRTDEFENAELECHNGPDGEESPGGYKIAYNPHSTETRALLDIE